MEYLDLDAGLESVLSGDHDRLVRLQSRVDERLTIADLRDCYRPGLCRSIGPDHPGIGAVRALLYRRHWDRQPVVPESEQQSTIDKFTGPKLTLRVGEVGAQLNRAGCLNDLVVDQQELAFVELCLVVLAVGQDGDRSFVQL